MSASRSLSVGSPSTTLTTWAPRSLPEPTSTLPALPVKPVFTPSTNGYCATSPLRLSTTRRRAPLASTAEGMSTMRAKRRLRSSRAARDERSRAVE